MRVPLADLAREFDLDGEDVIAAAMRVLGSGRYILGPEVEAFEREVSTYLGAAHAIGVGTGTDALWLALRAAGVGPGDVVLTTPFTFFATVSSIRNLGAIPVFADIDPDTFTIDPAGVAEVLGDGSSIAARQQITTSTIRAVVPVHLFGQPADMSSIIAIASEHGVPVIEDAAQAMGAQYDGRHVGTLGDLGCLSFFPTKNLGGFGDGGMVVTGSESLAHSVRSLSRHGSVGKYVHGFVGTNSRLDELQAAMLRTRMPRLDASIARRREIATTYDESLAAVESITGPHIGPKRTHTFHQYVIRVPAASRDELRRALAEEGVETAVHYPVPAHLQRALADLGYRTGDFPVAETASGEVVSLPLFPSMTPEEQEHVVSALHRATDKVLVGRGAA